MARFYKIQVGDDIFLTNTGETDGLNAELEVTNIEDLQTPVGGNVRPNADGTPDFQLYEWAKGKQFDVKVTTWLYKQEWDALVVLLIDSLENLTTFAVIGDDAGDGDGGFSVIARAFPDKPFSRQSFRNGKIFVPNFRFITV